MTKLLLVPALMLAACAENIQPDRDQASVSADDSAGEGASEPPVDENRLFAFFIYEPNECTDNSVRFEGHFGYPDGTDVENPICRYDFEDGTSIDSCRAVHSLPAFQRVVFTVTDPATGQVARGEEIVRGPESFSATADVSSAGLSISWSVHTLYGTAIDAGAVLVSFDPADKVIIDDPAVTREPSGTVQVTEPGTYTVHVNAFISFGELGGCGVFLDRTVTVTCPNGTHTH